MTKKMSAMRVALHWCRPLGLGCAVISFNAITACSADFAASSAVSPEAELLPGPAVPECLVGAYRSSNGELLAVTTPPGGGTRYSFLDGRRGWVEDPEAIVECAAGAVLVAHTDGTVARWPHVPLRMTRTTFESDGTVLAGKLIEAAASDDKPPLVVLAHGSESYGWIGGRIPTPYLFAASGISAFIFDKRGTGESGGTFHANFPRLAQDLAAAAREARRLAAGRHGRFGLHGFSQGGWVAPLAANDADADFVVVHYGLAISPFEEESEIVSAGLRDLGYSEDVLAKAREVVIAVISVVESGFESGYDELARVRTQYGEESWFGRIGGDITAELLGASESELRDGRYARYADLDLAWHYDSMPVLRSLAVPMLWVVAEKDRVAPPGATLERLALLQEAGRPVDIAVFPDTDHGILEFSVNQADGSREYTRFAEGYWRLLLDWTKGCQSLPYGRAEFVRQGAELESCID